MPSLPYHHYARHTPSPTGKIIILIGFVLMAYMLYSLTISIYKNYQIDRHISNFTQKNKQLAMENAKKIEDYQYYTSEAYVEKIAKQSLGLMKPGEEVIVIPQEEIILIKEIEEKNKKLQEEEQKISNMRRWWRFFFVKNPYK